MMKKQPSSMPTQKNPFGIIYQKSAGLSAKINNWLFIERVFLCLILCMIILIVWYTLLMLPLQTKMKTADQKLILAQQAIKKLTDQSEMISTQAQTTLEKNKQEYNTLSKQTIELEKQIKQYNKTFGDVSETANLLRKTLDKHPSLRLKNLATLPTTEVMRSETNKQVLLNHGVIIQFIGGYFHTLAYLKELEKSKRQLLWKSLTYTVSNYPDTNISITFSLLDKQQGEKWLARASSVKRHLIRSRGNIG